MDAQTVSGNKSRAYAEIPIVASDGVEISTEQFVEVCQGALSTVGGAMLFKMTLGSGVECHHIAAAFIGQGDQRQYLILSLPVAGGRLRVETLATSKNPIARIIPAYAELADAFSRAA